MDCKKVAEQCQDFIRDKVKEAGAKGIVLGISGGIDSAVVAALCIKAVGKSSCTFISIPARSKTPQEVAEGPDYQRILANTLGFEYDVVSIEPIMSWFGSRGMGHVSRLAWANLQARLRMVVQYYHANANNLLVVGTTNKTESLIGYYTKYGDGGVDIEPIADLYKTEVWELSKFLGVPKEIIVRAPTAGLWEGQTDEAEIGMAYKELDEVLKIIEVGPKGSGNVKVSRMIECSEHKRHMPPSPKLEKE